jgi:hypothetical protein
MSQGWGTFHTTEGEVAVADSAIRINRSPRKFLRGQFAQWRQGSFARRIQALVRIIGFCSLPLFFVWSLSTVSEMPLGLALFFSLSLLLFSVVPFWSTHFRETTIPLSSIEEISLDTETRELVIVQDQSGGAPPVDDGGFGDRILRPYLGWITGAGGSKTTLTLRSSEDIRKVKSVFRSRTSLAEFELTKPTQTETEYRVTSKNGVVFCADCGTQVSPSDRTCPSCGYVLRLRRPVEPDTQHVSTTN